MTLDRLNELKNTIYADYAGDDMFDLVDLINREIKRIESRRKVPLVPCRCGVKRIEQWRTPGAGRRVMVGYTCTGCGRYGDRKDTDREARLVWNKMMGGGEQ